MEHDRYSSYDRGTVPVDYPTSYPQRDRQNSSSTYQTGGYNSGSYQDVGRQARVKGMDDEADLGAAGHDEGWDVYADFNNAGPRYSTAFGQNASGYQPLPTPPVATPTFAESKSERDYTGGLDTGHGNVEMVTVPGMGAEWSKSELRDMTKAGKAERKQESRTRVWREWNRDERGCCGVPWLTRKTAVFIAFGVVIVVGVLIAVTLPRVPAFALNGDTPLTNGTGPLKSEISTQFSRAPTNFTFAANADLQLDTGGNVLPLRLTKLKAQIFDTDSDRLVATGELRNTVYKAHSFTHISLPLNFTYAAVNTSDTTWNNWYNACKNKALYPDGKRPGLRFKLLLTMDIFGLVGKHLSSTTVTDANCPVELSVNAA